MNQGRTALVTGASGGIGSALVGALLDAGISRVLACDLSSTTLTVHRMSQRSTDPPLADLEVTDPQAPSIENDSIKSRDFRVSGITERLVYRVGINVFIRCLNLQNPTGDADH